MKAGQLIFAAILATSCTMSSCQEEEIPKTLNARGPDPKPSLAVLQNGSGALKGLSGGKSVRIYSAEILTTGEGNEVGRTIYFNDRGNKQLEADFVPGLALDGTNNVSYYVDNSRSSNDLNASVTEAAIDRAMKTWDGVTCSDLGMTKIPYNKSTRTGFVAELLGFGGSLDYVADVVHAGWLPRSFFDQVAPGGGDFILGVTFTIVFEDQDADNNKKADVAWREIYYNDAFGWNNGSTYDVETVALHESGHGLSQAHFGSAFRTANQKLQFAPRAVMNAAYSGVQTTINQSDLGGHCSNWASWPNN